MREHTETGNRGLVSRKVLSIGLVVSCLIVIPGFALVLASSGMVKPAAEAMRPAAEAVHPVAEINPVVLGWMKDNSEMPEQILSDIYRAAVSNVNADLILAICVVESNFNPNVKSEKGAIGLMQILPRAWLDELKAQGIVQQKEDLYQISANIASGAYVLQKYLSRTRTLEKALNGYVGGDPAYVHKVMKALGELYLVKWSRPETA